MKYDNHHPTNKFPNSLPSHLFRPHITQQTRIKHSSITLIDNIFSNTLTENTISGNLLATRSGYLPRFVIYI